MKERKKKILYQKGWEFRSKQLTSPCVETAFQVFLPSPSFRIHRAYTEEESLNRTWYYYLVMQKKQ